MSTSRRTWNAVECGKILDYMRRVPFEIPNGVMYYKKMRRDLNFGVDYRLLRCKVNNLLSSYRKVKSMMSVQDTPMEDIEKVCPYYKQLRSVYHRCQKTPRRNTICGKPKSSPMSPHSTTYQEQTVSEMDDHISVCSSASNRVMVHLPTSSDANTPVAKTLKPIVVKEENEIVDNGPFQTENDEYGLTEIAQSYPEITQSQPDITESEPRIPSIVNAFSDIDVTSTGATSMETEHLDERMVMDGSAIISSHGIAMSEQDLKLMELRLREKKLDLKLYEIQSLERLERLKMESKERMTMKKLALKYAKK